MNLAGRLGVLGGVSGVLAAGATAVGVSRHRDHRRPAGRPVPVGVLHTDRSTTVAADDGVPLLVAETGAGDAPMTVVLVHGFCLSMASWAFQRDDLAARDDVRVVSYDQRGHGGSGASHAESCTINQLGRDLLAVLRTVAPGRRVVLVGHSMGGMTIMAMARQEPELFDERVAGVVLVATSAGGLGGSWLGRGARHPVLETVRRIRLLRPDLLQRGRAPFDGLLGPVIRAMSYGDAGTSREVAEFSERLIAATPLRTVVDFLPTLLEHDELAALPRLAGRPVVVCCGDADRMTPFRHTAVIADVLTDAELLRVPRSGHLVQLERPEVVTAAITRVLARAGRPVRVSRASRGA